MIHFENGRDMCGIGSSSKDLFAVTTQVEVPPFRRVPAVDVEQLGGVDLRGT